MSEKKRKITILQMITMVLVVLYLIWEKNVQQYAATQSDGGDSLPRMDLLFILPVLALFIGISIWQYFKK